MLDARGLVCPMPVIMVQKEIKANAPKTFEVIVDNQTAVENITRFVNSNGYSVTVKEQDIDFVLTISK